MISDVILVFYILYVNIDKTLLLLHKLTCAGGFRFRFFQFREAHFKNQNNETVPGGVMQGLLYSVPQLNQ